MSKILITGATGGLGSTIIEFLEKKIGNTDIAVLVRDKEGEKAKDYSAKGFDVRVADYDNYSHLENAFKGIDVLFFISASDINSRLAQHKNVVDAATKVGVKHILYTSTVRTNESENAPLFPVVNAHVQTEDWIKQSGMDYTILRHNLYGEVIPMFLGDKSQVLQSKTVYLPTENGKTAFVPRRDFAEAEAIILSNPSAHVNRVYEFNGNEAASFAQVAQYLSETTGEKISHVSPSVKEFETSLKSFGLPAEIIGMTTMFCLGIGDGEFDKSQNDLENILGRKTQSIASFIGEVYQ